MMEKKKRQRVSSTQAQLDGITRTVQRNEIIYQLLHGLISRGQALKTLRIEVLGINQVRYCQIAHISRQTLSDIENDKGNYSVETINQAFKPMGLELGIVPIAKKIIHEVMTKQS